MVYKFADISVEKIAATQKQMAQKIQKWWQAFEANRTNIERFLTDLNFQWDIEHFVEQNLQSIHPDLMWEVDGSPHSNELFMVITPEAERYLRPLTDAIIAAAPKTDRWNFLSYRQPRSFQETDEALKESTGISAQKLVVQVVPAESNKVSLNFVLLEATSTKDPVYKQLAFVATEHLLGEEILDRWVDEISVQPAKGNTKEHFLKKGFVTVDAMANQVFQCIKEAREKTPERPLYDIKDTLTRADFSLEADKAADYPERLDMMAASSIIPSIWKAAHSDVPFDSRRFSRFGERFCYLKMDGTESYANSAQSRDRVAQTLNEKLSEAKLGCTTGGAGGLRYSYIDLCLLDVEKSLPILKEVLAYEHMPERSWLLFFDDEWSREWVGMRPTSPPPPMMEDPYEAF